MAVPRTALEEARRSARRLLRDVDVALEGGGSKSFLPASRWGNVALGTLLGIVVATVAGDLLVPYLASPSGTAGPIETVRPVPVEETATVRVGEPEGRALAASAVSLFLVVLVLMMLVLLLLVVSPSLTQRRFPRRRRYY